MDTHRDDAVQGAAPDRRVNFFTFMATFGALSYGYDTGVISGALPFMKKGTDEGGLGLTAFQEGIVSSSLIFGAVFGSLMAGRLADRKGRRLNLIVMGSLFVIGSLGCALAGNTEVMIAFRFVLGLAVGGVSATVPTFIAEMAPAHRRTTLVSRNEFMIVFGQLLAYTTNATIANVAPGQHSWRWMLAICLLPGAALFIGMLFVPESPRWLAATGRVDEARQVLRSIRTGDVERELGDVVELVRRAESEKLTPAQALATPWIRNIVVIGAILGILLQFTGINAVMYYAPSILVQTGLGENAALTATIGNGVVSVLAVSFGIWMARRAPRRKMLQVGVMGIVTSLTALWAVFSLMPESTFRSYSVLACMLVFLCFQQSCFAVVYWLLMSEIFPLRVRGLAVGIAVLMKWLANTIIVLLFPVLISTLGGPTFLIFAVVNLIGFFFIRACLPETQGRTLEGFERDLQANSPDLKLPGRDEIDAERRHTRAVEPATRSGEDLPRQP